jgi:uncharacterized protein YktA (UPF0223 family)
MKFTESDIRQISCNSNVKGGISITRKQAELLNIEYPLKTGWISKVILKDYEPNIFEKLLQLRNKQFVGRKEKLLRKKFKSITPSKKEIKQLVNNIKSSSKLTFDCSNHKIPYRIYQSKDDRYLVFSEIIKSVNLIPPSKPGKRNTQFKSHNIIKFIEQFYFDRNRDEIEKYLYNIFNYDQINNIDKISNFYHCPNDLTEEQFDRVCNYVNKKFIEEINYKK